MCSSICSRNCLFHFSGEICPQSGKLFLFFEKQPTTTSKPAFPPCCLRGVKYCKAMKLLERITVEPGKCGGHPCIRGKRMRVTDVLDLLSHGASHEEVLADYPFLEPDDILAAIAYASRLTDHVVLTTV